MIPGSLEDQLAKIETAKAELREVITAAHIATRDAKAVRRELEELAADVRQGINDYSRAELRKLLVVLLEPMMEHTRQRLAIAIAKAERLTRERCESVLDSFFGATEAGAVSTEDAIAAYAVMERWTEENPGEELTGPPSS